MKRRLLTVATLSLASAGLYVGARVAVTHVLANVDLNVKPFVATIEHSVTIDGKTVKSADEVVGRARSGGIAHLYTAYNAEGKVVLSHARKIEMPNGFVAMVADGIKAKATGHRNAISLAQSKMALENVTSDCVERGQNSREVFEGGDTLLGQHAVRIKTEQNGLQRTVWRLPDYNCKVVQSILVIPAHNGSPGKTVEARLKSFIPVEPDTSMFTIGSDYKEMLPSQLVRQQIGKQGVPVSNKEKEADQNYSKMTR